MPRGFVSAVLVHAGHCLPTAPGKMRGEVAMLECPVKLQLKSPFWFCVVVVVVGGGVGIVGVGVYMITYMQPTHHHPHTITPTNNITHTT